MIVGYLPDSCRFACARVCRQWRHSIVSNAFDGLIYLKSESSEYNQNFVIHRLCPFARGLFFFDLKCYQTTVMLGEAAERCDPSRLRTLTFFGDEVVGAFRGSSSSKRQQQPPPGVNVITNLSEDFVLPSLGQFLRGKSFSIADKLNNAFRGEPFVVKSTCGNTSTTTNPATNPTKRRRNTREEDHHHHRGFPLEHFGLVSRQPLIL